MFRTVPLSIIRCFSLYTQQWYISYRFADSKSVNIAVCTVKTTDDGQRNCPKHVEFYSKNKFDKLVHLVGFIIRTLLCYCLWSLQYHFIFLICKVFQYLFFWSFIVILISFLLDSS